MITLTRPVTPADLYRNSSTTLPTPDGDVTGTVIFTRRNADETAAVFMHTHDGFTLINLPADTPITLREDFETAPEDVRPRLESALDRKIRLARLSFDYEGR